MFSNEKMNEMFTSQESVENTQEQLKVIIEVTDRTLSRVNEKDPQQTVSVLALRTQSLALTMANHTISELYMKTLRLERELEALRAQSCRFSA
ncbi:TPA: hypothetical protein N7B85_003333 [Escherichia coli]|uniref:hypothetical protein n=1 Tax=Escherichia coli TaxID=562 RepID=UPI000BEAD7B3|nr:hypothetical protein [Escherichia coli]EFN8406246.1 hypothetical protein [Escherichia coli O15]EIE8788189.1 hypothetical protein [Escherichia coli]EKJ4601193.1 hypothetical protein [Escherichia coli]MBC0883072.1 hypothetical protein [Escherichia coli]MBD3049696.1 hypothetical protein [Escherichia coli]